MSYNTTPLFGRQETINKEDETDLEVSPTKPLDLRASIIRAQNRSSSNTIRFSTIAQRLTEEGKHASVQSSNTYTSNDTFLTARSEEFRSQNELHSHQGHPFSAFTKSKEALTDLNSTPVVQNDQFIDNVTPKANNQVSSSPSVHGHNSNNHIVGLGLSHDGHQYQNSDHDPNGTIISDTDDGNTTQEFTFDSYGKSAHNGILLSAGETIDTPTSTISRAKEENEPVLQGSTKNVGPEEKDEENLAYLFIIAVHSFNVSSLENKEDAAICISFEKDDAAFVHSVDESGWGEVTLIKNMQRGWVPFNYFADAVKQEKPSKDKDELEVFIETRKPLEQLLSASAKFILNPQNRKLEHSNHYSFDINYINRIRDGVKILLLETDCVSRSNDFVQKKPMIKKMRKRLLAEWYNLMIKADSYKNTTSTTKIQTLVSLTFAILRKAFLFYEIWWVERRSYELEKQNLNRGLNQLQRPSTTAINNKPEYYSSVTKSTTRKELPNLKTPPSASTRLKEIHDILFTYFGLILGRLDMIEHSPANCEILESIVHQIILLLRELLYISQACSSIIQEKYNSQYENNLDYNLDPLLSLVSELVSCVKVFVTQTIKEKYDDNNNILLLDDIYYYTDEGEHMILIIAQMTRLISNAVSGCNNYLKLIGDFQLSDERKYPAFYEIRISPEQFIKKCSNNMVKKLNKNPDQFHSFLEENRNKIIESPSFSKKLARFSTIRSGNQSNILSPGGSQMLLDYMPDKKSFFGDPQFELFTPDQNNSDDSYQINDTEAMKEEILTDKEDRLIGISFRALVFMVTDEMKKFDEKLLFTFLLNYKSFGTSEELLECLILRFDTKGQSTKYALGEKNGTFSSLASRVRSRRRQVCKVINIWIESYWDYERDYKLIPTMINFFNEEVSQHLPIEAKILIETAAKLAAYTPKYMEKHLDGISQLVPRNVNPVKKTNSMISVASSTTSSHSSSTTATIDEQFIERYELTKLPHSSHSTISLPVPILSLGSSSLLTRRNLSDIERIVLNYRDMVGFPNGSISTKTFVSNYSLVQLIKEWMKLVANSKKQSSPRSFIHNDLNLSELNPLEVAKQLSLIESSTFIRITPSEILKGKYSSKNIDLSDSPNVNCLITLTNLLSNYVLESILTPGITLKKRAARLNAWLRIALSALYFRNFNTLASIMTTLQSYVISRLSMIWNILSDEDVELYDYLSKIIHPNNNYKVYRKKLDHLISESSSSNGVISTKSLLPTVPFFNLFLQDLTFIDEGNPKFRNPDSFRPHKLVNIDKYFKITGIVALLQFFQVGYDMDSKISHVRKRDSFLSLTGTIDIDSKSIKPVPELQEFILFEFWRVNTLYIKDSDRAYALSLELLPRN